MFIVKRAEENPILSPKKEHPWEAAAAFNWCPIKEGKLIHAVYRAVSEKQLLEEPKINRSIIGRATSTDGVHFTDRAPFITPSEEFDKYGCEDPRTVKIDNLYYTFYTALGGFPFSADNIKIAVAISKDLKTVQKKYLVTPFNAKAMSLFPEKVNGKYTAILTVNTDRPPTNVAIAVFDKLEDMWSKEYWDKWYSELDSHILDLHRSNDDQVELGAPPVKTKQGWLILYSHATHYFSSPNHIFGIEAVILDKKDPRSILGRTKGAFLVPEVYYEITGMVSRIVFPSGALLRGDYLDIYYGAADTFCCKATFRLEDLIQSILPNSQALLTRFPGNPIIAARPNKAWEAHGTLNPAAIDLNNKIHIVYRAMGDDDTSTFGYATTENGFLIDERSSTPIYTPRADFEKKYHPGNSGCEDPRLITIDKNIIMIYVAYDGSTPRVALTTISEADFIKKQWKKWSDPVIITPYDVTNKDACLVPEKTANGYVFLHRVDESICADLLTSLDFSKEKVRRCIEIISPRRGMWDGRKVGAAAPPIKTKAGWLFFYHGVSETGTYRVGAVLLDLKDPTIVLSRTAVPIFEPEEDYELKGVVSKVVFPCGVVKRGDKLFIYYGGADDVVGVATAKLSAILKILT